MEHFTDIFLLVFCYATIWFLIALVLKNNGIMDIAWGLGFCLIAGYGYSVHSGSSPGTAVVLMMVLFWGLRLSGYILWRSIGKPEDWRYKNWRDTWKFFYLRSYFQIYMLQGLLMIVVSLPVINVLFSAEPPQELGVLQFLGFGLWLIGFLWESISDYQLYRFKQRPENKGKIMTKGLWSYSRHPNYFGEILLWFGIFVFSIPYGKVLFSLVGFLVIAYLVAKVSGVTMLERKYTDNPAYQKYIETTWALIPKLF